MPHFTSKEKLKAFLLADQVVALFSKMPAEQQEELLTMADARITDVSGVEPNGATDDPTLVSIASRIVIWFASGQQQWNDNNRAELERRESLYKEALHELDAYDPPGEQKGVRSHSNERRTGEW